MDSFDTVFDNVKALGRLAGREPISPELEPLLRALHHVLSQRSIKVTEVKAATVDVLRYLTTPTGRTDANCWAVNLFMLEDWGPVELDLAVGDALNDVLADMGGALHDTIEYPDIARMFESTPEQLLQRVEAILA